MKEITMEEFISNTEQIVQDVVSYTNDFPDVIKIITPNGNAVLTTAKEWESMREALKIVLKG